VRRCLGLVHDASARGRCASIAVASASCASFFVENDFFDCRRRSPSSHDMRTTHGFLRSSRRHTVPLAMRSPGATGRILLPKHRFRSTRTPGEPSNWYFAAPLAGIEPATHGSGIVPCPSGACRRIRESPWTMGLRGSLVRRVTSNPGSSAASATQTDAAESGRRRLSRREGVAGDAPESGRHRRRQPLPTRGRIRGGRGGRG